MKKFIFILLSLFMVQSCFINDIRTDYEGNQVISFEPISRKQHTRSTPLSKYESTTGDFAVFSWYQRGTGSFDPVNNDVVLYMDNVVCSYDEINGKGTWMPVTTYFWSKNGKLTFSAYYPVGDVFAPNVNVDTKTGLKFNDYDIANAVDQKDLMFSSRTYDKSASIHPDDFITTYDGVDILFNHALSAISFTVKSRDDYNGVLLLKRIELIDVKHKGSFDENLTDGYAVNKSVWSVDDDNVDYKIYESTETYGTIIDMSGVVFTDANTGIVLPQVFDDNAKIRITYYIKYGTDKYLEQVNDVKLKDLKKDGIVSLDAWEMGKWYKYNITFGLDQIYFAPAVEEWVDVIVR